MVYHEGTSVSGQSLGHDGISAEKPRQHGVTRKRILREALMLFVTKGYAETGMEDLATCVGVRKASLYAHFRKKEDIFDAVFDAVMAEHAAHQHTMIHAPEGLTQTEVLQRYVRGMVAFWRGNMGQRFLFRYYVTPPSHAIGEVFQRTSTHLQIYCDHGRDIVRRGLVTGEFRHVDPDEAAHGIHAMLLGLQSMCWFLEISATSWGYSDESDPIAWETEACLAMMLNMLRGPEPPHRSNAAAGK